MQQARPAANFKKGGVAWCGVAWRSLLTPVSLRSSHRNSQNHARSARAPGCGSRGATAHGSQRQVGQAHHTYACRRAAVSTLATQECAHLADHVRAVASRLEALGQRGLVEWQRRARRVDEGDVDAVVEDVTAREQRGARRAADGLNVVILETDAGRT